MLPVESDPYMQTLQMMIYYLVDKTGGVAMIDFSELEKFAKTHMFYVADLEDGIAFRVTEIMENEDVAES